MDKIDEIIKRYEYGQYSNVAEFVSVLEQLRPELKTEMDKLLIELGELILQFDNVYDITQKFNFFEWTDEIGKLKRKYKVILKQIKELEK